MIYNYDIQYGKERTVKKVIYMINAEEFVHNAINCNGGVIKTSELLNRGLSKPEIYKLQENGIIKQIQHGYYCIGNEDINNISIYILLNQLIPNSIICLYSALEHYGYINNKNINNVITIAVPRDYSRSKLKTNLIPFKAYFVPKDIFEIGKTVVNIQGSDTFMYDRERTICDCFRYRTKIDSEVFNKALHSYLRDVDRDLSKLLKYAKELGIFKKVSGLMDVLIEF